MPRLFSRLFPIVLLGALAISACSKDSEVPAPNPSTSSSTDAAPPGSLEIVFPFGSEKEDWLEAVTKDFNAAGHESSSGKPIYIKLMPMGSGECMEEVRTGRVQAHLVSPASGAFIELANATHRTETGKNLVERSENLVLSPVVIAMWKPMAQAMGWPDKQIGWGDILDIAQSGEGWKKYNMPQWGKFRFGHTHPEYSNSGLISLLAEVYAATGKTRGLTREDVAKSETAKYLEEIEQAVVHYGSSTGFFGKTMFNNGPSYLSAAVMYENMVIEAERGDYNLSMDVVALYPKEGTFWSDHPCGLVNAAWNDDEHKEAAQSFIDYLLEKPQQERAMQFGFRPSDVKVPLAAPIDEAHGVNPKEPKTTLEVPGADVMNDILKLWSKKKKHSNVIVVLDTSGSMQQDQRMQNAKLGAQEMIKLLHDEDSFSLLSFSDEMSWLGKGSPVGAKRAEVERNIASLFPEGRTRLYDSILEAHKYARSAANDKLITAIVVLTDGEDTRSQASLTTLLARISAGENGDTVPVFTIGYSTGDAQNRELSDIAERTRAKFYKGTPENIREVFKSISTFF
ncbi:MAG: VWA domain-containing protein [Planctomycetes bacterium]|nr:VWA domain-containing protein [Planctomycetota bacterium]